MNGDAEPTVNDRHVRAKSTPPPSAIIVAGVGQEMRFGRWVSKKGEGVLNGALVVALHARTSSSS